MFEPIGAFFNVPCYVLSAEQASMHLKKNMQSQMTTQLPRRTFS